MSVAMRKGVVLLVVLFVGWLMFTDPGGLAEMSGDLLGKTWSLLVDLFEAVARFISALGD